MRHPVQRENFIRGGWVHREEPNFKRITRDLEVAGPHIQLCRRRTFFREVQSPTSVQTFIHTDRRSLSSKPESFSKPSKPTPKTRAVPTHPRVGISKVTPQHPRPCLHLRLSLHLHPCPHLPIYPPPHPVRFLRWFAISKTELVRIKELRTHPSR